MKKLAVFSGLLAAVCLVATRACNKDASTNPALTKTTVDPDTTIGYTTFYSYAVRMYPDGKVRRFTFAAFDRYWYALASTECSS